MTKEIVLKGGDIALVDDEDYPLLSRYEWQRSGSAGYAATTMQTAGGKNYTIYMHKLIMGGFWIIDHINLDPLDNRKANLRRATKQQNEWNKAKFKTSRGMPPTSKYKGVSLQGNRWNAKIMRHKVLYDLGSYKTEEEAARAYNKKAKELSEGFEWLNPVPELTMKTV